MRARACAALLGLAAGVSACAPPSADCDLGLRLDAQGCAAVRAMARPTTPPPAVGNRVADDPRAASLGFRLFFDRRLSATGAHACGTCHEPSIAFMDGRRLPSAPGMVPRNTPSVSDVAWSRWLFWDGRADSLWMQATMPIESPVEMQFTRLGVAHVVDRYYRADYEAIFGAMPDVSAWPEAGRPGDPAYDALPDTERGAADLVLANVGKAMEAYERVLVTGPSALDRFLAGETDALDVDQLDGIELFVSAGCADCHAGPTLTDSAFHNVGTSSDTPEGHARASVYEGLAASPFASTGPFFDGDPSAAPRAEPSASDLGAYRTPPLRNVTRTAPYGHDGRWATLADAIRAHASATTTEVGALDPRWAPLALSDDEIASIVAFLRALEGAPPPLPWSRWPSG